MAETKPASKVIAKAMPVTGGDWWYATYALPGLIPLKVTRDGKTLLYGTEEAAKTDACVALVEALQKRVIDDRKPSYIKAITPAQFGVLLTEADTTPTYFAELYGVMQERVIQWLDGQRDVPHSAYVLVKLMADGAIFQKVERLTTERKE